jgi:radical SAM-linked protein
MLDTVEILRRQRLLHDLGRARKLEIRTHSEPLSRLEAILCRGDIRLASAVEKAVDLGARFDGWSEQFRQDIWDEALSDVDQHALLGPVGSGERTAWDHVTAGVSETFLHREREKADTARTTAPCGRFTTSMPDVDRFVCHHCGAGCARESVPLRADRGTADVDSLPAPKPIKKGKPLPRSHNSGNGISQSRVMLYLSKWGRQVFVGHLDTMRQVMRSLRRAGLDVFYTQGFNPKPKLSSAPPLPLGMAAMADPLEVSLINPPEVGEILNRLNRVVPEDMAFVDAEIIPKDGRRLSKRLIEARFVAMLREPEDVVLSGRDRVLAQRSILVSRTRKGKTTDVDVRPYIHTVDVLAARPNHLPLPPDLTRIPVSFSLYLPGSGGCKPSELLSEMIGDSAGDSWVVRTEIALEPVR